MEDRIKNCLLDRDANCRAVVTYLEETNDYNTIEVILDNVEKLAEFNKRHHEYKIDYGIYLKGSSEIQFLICRIYKIAKNIEHIEFPKDLEGKVFLSTDFIEDIEAFGDNIPILDFSNIKADIQFKHNVLCCNFIKWYLLDNLVIMPRNKIAKIIRHYFLWNKHEVGRILQSKAKIGNFAEGYGEGEEIERLVSRTLEMFNISAEEACKAWLSTAFKER